MVLIVQCTVQVYSIMHVHFTVCLFDQWYCYIGKNFTKNITSYFKILFLWFKLWQCHQSNIQTVNGTYITLYNYTLDCTIRTRAQSVRRQHRKMTSEKIIWWLIRILLRWSEKRELIRHNQWIQGLYLCSQGNFR